MRVRNSKKKTASEQPALSVARKFLLPHIITATGPLHDLSVLELGFEDTTLLSSLQNLGAVKCAGVQHRAYGNLSPVSAHHGNGLQLYSGDITSGFYFNQRYDVIVLDRQLSGHFNESALDNIALNARKNIARNGKLVIVEPASRALINGNFVKITGGVTKDGQHPIKRNDLRISYHWDIKTVVSVFSNRGFSLTYSGVNYPKPSMSESSRHAFLKPWTVHPMAYILTFKVD
jgi:hypothetical protein